MVNSQYATVFSPRGESLRTAVFVACSFSGIGALLHVSFVFFCIELPKDTNISTILRYFKYELLLVGGLCSMVGAYIYCKWG